MTDDRQEWVPPQLIVLGRGAPEENVLVGCKTSALTGMSATKVSCKKVVFTFCGFSTNCNTISATS